MQSPQSSQRPPMKGDDASQGTHFESKSSSSSRVPLLGIVFTLIVLTLATVVALRQAPHPDMLRAVGPWEFGNPSWWAYPLERNAFKRNIIRGNLRDVTAVPATSLRWAVGEGGLILHSQDGGRSWVQQHPAPVVVPGKLSFNVVGDAHAGDLPAASKDSKSPRYQPSKQVVQKSIEPQPQPGSAIDVQQNALPRLPVEPNVSKTAPDKQPAQTKIESPIRAAVPASKDPLRATLNSVYFNDAQHGWAAGSDGALLVTADGGESWRAQPSGTDKDIFTVIFSSDMRRGWLVLADNHLRITEDGGLSWREQDTFDDTPILRELLRATGRPTLGLRSSNDRGLIRATGDEVWVMAQNALTVARPGGNATVAQWPDFAAASMQISGDGQRIAAGGSRGEIRFSADAGKTWQSIETGRHGDVQAMHCDETLSQCIAVGDSGSVLIGEDLLANAANWRSLTPGVGASFIWARFKNGEAGDEGEAVTGTNLQLRTNDGGMNWEVLGESKLPAETAKYANTFIDGKYQWRVGILGKAERSLDGGDNWQAMPTGSDNWLWSVFFLRDHQRGWIAGSDGEILATRDGGKSWQVQPTPTRNWLWHVSMDGDGKHGRALGGYGTVLQTNDGGVRWQESAPYRRYPAPWFSLLLVLGGTLLTVLVPRYLRSRNQGPDEALEGPAGSLNSDQPITQLQQDRLGYRPAIEALANFLRNSATEPRITIAVSGPWGSGKSSMMRMLQTEMQEKGYRTAWFNAWHHQQEGRQLTALFNVVRRQGVPTFFRQPVAALRVRSRLIWGRSAFYRVVCIAIPLVVLVAVGDFSRQPDRWERFKWWVAHQTLQWDRVVVTDKSIDKLKPIEVKAPTDQSTPKAEPTAAATSTQSRVQVRPEVLAYMKNALVWESGEKRHCGDKRNIAEEDRCVFKQPEQLLVTIEKGTGLTLWPSEREVILKAAEPIKVPPLFPALEHFIVPMLGLLGLLFTKGMTVYGLEVLRPLRNIFGTAAVSEGGKEASGAIEHYRREYCLLTEALDGRLLVFVDDIDRCNADTVNGIMELTNYLVDVGRCFVVLGMAMDRVKTCINTNGMKADPEYADQYLRKLIHIELPVPLANARESLGLFMQNAGAALQGEEARLEARRRWFAQLWAIAYPWLKRVTIFVLLIVTISLAVTTGRVLNNYRQPPALDIPPVEEVVNASATNARVQPGALPGALSPLPAASAPLQTGDVGLEREAPTRMPWTLLGVLGGLLLLGLAIGSSRVLQERVTLALGGAMRTRDSDNFRLALETWLNAVRMHDDTPRGIKRFCNRARLFALYEKQDVAALQRDGKGISATPDVHIVALAAIHHVSPEALKQLLNENKTRQDMEGLSLLRPFVDEHTRLFGWPDAEAIERFIERVERIAVR